MSISILHVSTWTGPMTLESRDHRADRMAARGCGNAAGHLRPHLRDRESRREASVLELAVRGNSATVAFARNLGGAARWTHRRSNRRHARFAVVGRSRASRILG